MYKKEKKKGEIAIIVLKYHKKSVSICVILTYRKIMLLYAYIHLSVYKHAHVYMHAHGTYMHSAENSHFFCHPFVFSEGSYKGLESTVKWTDIRFSII